MSEVRVLFFGPARDAAGQAETVVPLAAGMRLGTLIDALMTRHPGLAPSKPSLRFAVNGTFAKADQPLSAGDEIAVIPPVSGGQEEPAWVELTEEEIDAERVRRHVSADPSLGGIVTFEGATRSERDPRHGALLRLEYQAYDSMAIAEMRRLAAHASERWPIGRMALLHRTGMVAAGGISVMIAVACPHRAEAFEACRWLIDSLKQVVPIWKREHWASGASTWVDPTTPEASDAQA